jgi:hypothetical protein
MRITLESGLWVDVKDTLVWGDYRVYLSSLPQTGGITKQAFFDLGTAMALRIITAWSIAPAEINLANIESLSPKDGEELMEKLISFCSESFHGKKATASESVLNT